MRVIRKLSRPFAPAVRQLAQLGRGVARLAALGVIIGALFIALDAALLRDAGRH